MNGEKHNGEEPQQTADDIWAPVTVTEPDEYEGQVADYERDLDAAGIIPRPIEPVSLAEPAPEDGPDIDM